MEISVVSDRDAFLALESDWRWIHAEAPDVSIFSGWDWLSLWWEHYGDGRELRVLVARVDGEVVGILPMYLERSRLGRVLPIRHMRMIGVGGDTSPDYLSPIVLDAYRKQAHTRFAQWLVEGNEWHMVHLRDLVKESGFAEALHSVCRAHGVECLAGITARIAVVSLPPTWQDYLDQLDRNSRHGVMRYLKRAEGRSNTRFYWHNDLATIDKAIDKLIQLHRMRWQGRGSRHSFSSDRYVAFHRAVMKRLAERDELALQCFEHDGEIIAMQYGYLFRGRLYDFQGGFNPDYASLRPGRVLTAWALRDAIERGFREYDFLKGDYQHKLLWTRQVRETEYIRAFGCGWRGRMAYLRHGVLPGLKRRIRQFRSWTQATVLANISTICDPGWVSGV